MTLKNGIEAAVKRVLPEIKSVESVDTFTEN
jgi:Fe-S cluster biogenesis protein NfuA